MRKIQCSAAILLFQIYSVAQVVPFGRIDITPHSVEQIGGLSLSVQLPCILLPTGHVYSQKQVQLSETKRIQQKYAAWEIYSMLFDSVLENQSHTWNIIEAVPYGFSFFDENTVVFVGKKYTLESNNWELEQQLEKVLPQKEKCLYPSVDSLSGRIYFSSNMPGGCGGFDIWYIEKGIEGWSGPKNAGERVNSGANELESLRLNDSLFVFSSDRTKEKGADIFFFNLKQSKYVETNPDVNSSDDELFFCKHDSVSIDVVSREKTGDHLYTVPWVKENVRETVPLGAVLPVTMPALHNNENSGPELNISNESEDGDDVSLTKYFGVSQYDLTPAMKDSLVKIAKMINSDKNQSVLICGHASPDGTDYLNMKLSYFRANAAYNELKDRNVRDGAIFRVYGGEYLFQETTSARRFSVFSLAMTDIPNKLVVIQVNGGNEAKEVLSRFGMDADEEAGIKMALSGYLPVNQDNVLLVPVSFLCFAKEGESITQIAEKYGKTKEQIMKLNGLTSETIETQRVIYIP